MNLVKLSLTGTSYKLHLLSLVQVTLIIDELVQVTLIIDETTFNTKIALNAWVLYLASVPRRRAENSAFHLPAHHVTSPDTSRGETQHARLKSVQSQNAPSLFSCAKSLRRRISSQIGWLTQNSERAVSQLIRAMVRAMVWTRQRTVPRPV